MEELLQIGAIASTHGVRGEVKVFSMTDDVNRFRDLEEVYLDTGKGMKLLHVISCKMFKNTPILKFKEFDNINDIEVYKRCGLFVDRAHAVELKEDEYFIVDLIGTTVKTVDGSELGELVDVLQTGANDVYVVKTQEEKEILLPAIKDCVKKIDLEAGVIEVVLMKGLLDE